MFWKIICIIIIPLFILSCKDNKPKAVVAEEPLLAINPSEFVEKSFNLSDLADSIVIMELAPDYPFDGWVGQITSDRMIVEEYCKSFKYFDRQGHMLGEIGKVGQGSDEYPQNSAFVFNGTLECFYDNCRNLYAVFSDIPTKRGIRLRYYDQQGEYYGSIRLNHPDPEYIRRTSEVYFSEGYFYLVSSPTSIREEIAVIVFDSLGNLVREVPNDVNKTCFIRNFPMYTNYYRDHLLLSGFNDTIYEVHGKVLTPMYRWDIPKEMRRKLEDIDFKHMSVSAVQENEFSAGSIVDTKEWLIVRGYIHPTSRYYFYNKEEGVWYGNTAPKNDLGYYDFESIIHFFDGYYYDEASDEEWLYHTFRQGAQFLEALEETDDPRSITMRKELSEKEDINPVLVMVRLKKQYR